MCIVRKDLLRRKLSVEVLIYSQPSPRDNRHFPIVHYRYDYTKVLNRVQSRRRNHKLGFWRVEVLLRLRYKCDTLLTNRHIVLTGESSDHYLSSSLWEILWDHRQYNMTPVVTPPRKPYNSGYVRFPESFVIVCSKRTPSSLPLLNFKCQISRSFFPLYDCFSFVEHVPYIKKLLF